MDDRTAFWSRMTAALGGDTLRRLAVWKMTYRLEADGFTMAQAQRLIFTRWLAYQHGMSDVPLPLAQRVASIASTSPTPS